MIQKIVLVSVLTFILASTGLCQPSTPIIKKLPTGLTLIMLEDHTTELVGVDVWVKAGTINETKENNGLSHFIEHLVFSTTDNRKPGDMDIEMESLGATLDARTSRDWAHFSTTVSSRYLSKALEILADAVSFARFQRSDVEQEKLVILDEIAKVKTDPMSYCRDLLAHELYGGHPYSMPVEGTDESVSKINVEQIQDYYYKHYVTKNTAVVLVGDIDPEVIEAEISERFKMPRLTKGEAVNPQTIPSPLNLQKQIAKSINAAYSNNYVAIGFLGPRGSEYKEVCATDLLLTAIGFGYQSWTKMELEKTGLASNTAVEFLTQKDQGLITIIAGTKPENTSGVKDAILAKLADTRVNGLDANSLMFAKRSLLGQFAFQNETVGGLATTYGFYFAVSDPEFTAKYIDCVTSITNEDIINAARKYLDTDKAVILTVGSNVEAGK